MNEPAAQSVVQPKASLWRSLKMVGWAFLGIRKASDSRDDAAQVKPTHVIGVALGAVLVIVILLISIVHWVVLK